MVTYQEVRANEDIKTYIKMADETMASMRFTEHSFAHVVRCADVAGGILEKLGYDESEAGSADNCGKAKNEKDEEDDKKEDKKVENEDEKDEEKVEELKEDVKKDVENKCKNSKESPFDEMMKIYNASFAPSQEEVYTSREAREQAAEDYFRK